MWIVALLCRVLLSVCLLWVCLLVLVGDKVGVKRSVFRKKSVAVEEVGTLYV